MNTLSKAASVTGGASDSRWLQSAAPKMPKNFNESKRLN
jgi:hypothetical protein